MRHFPPEAEEAEGSGPTPRSSRLQKFLSFADEKEEVVKTRSNSRQLEKASTGSSTLRHASNRTIDFSLNVSRITNVELSPSQSDGLQQ